MTIWADWPIQATRWPRFWRIWRQRLCNAKLRITCPRLPCAWNCRLLRSRNRLLFVIVRIEDGQQFCDLKKVLRGFCEVQEFHVSLTTLQCCVGRNQFPHSAAVNLRNPGQVQYEFP